MNTGRRFSCQLAGFFILYSLFPDDHGATLRADPDLVLSPCCHVYTLAHGVRFLGRALVLGIGYGEAAFRDEVRRQSPVAVRGVVGAPPSVSAKTALLLLLLRRRHGKERLTGRLSR